MDIKEEILQAIDDTPNLSVKKLEEKIFGKQTNNLKRSLDSKQIRLLGEICKILNLKLVPADDPTDILDQLQHFINENRI